MTDNRQTAIHQAANLGRSCTHTPKASLTARQWVSTPFFRIVVLPIFILAAAVALEYTGLDLKWEALFFDTSSRTWIFKNHWLFDHILHDGGRLLDMTAAGIWLCGFIGVMVYKPLHKYRKPMLFFLTATAAGPAIVGILKQTTHIYTPWEIKPFSGPYPYIRLFDPVPGGLPVGEAFPAGHASGGYAFLSFYFLLHLLDSPRKNRGLIAGLILGGIYGFGQQFRGAHFPSHDLFTAVICWYASCFFYYLFYPKQWRSLIHD